VGSNRMSGFCLQKSLKIILQSFEGFFSFKAALHPLLFVNENSLKEVNDPDLLDGSKRIAELCSSPNPKRKKGI